MIRSMTAFAAGERTTPSGTLGCELRAVNHRFLEIGTRLPEDLRVLEPAMRKRIGERVSRGKLDLSMRLRPAEGGDALRVDDALLSQLGAIAMRIEPDFPQLRADFASLLAIPGVLQTATGDPEALKTAAMSLLDEVLDDFIAAREREGAQLAIAIAERVDGIEQQAAQARALMPDIRAGQRAKLDARLADLAQPADPGRVEQELVLWLQKLDIDEELDRLDSHIVEIRRVLEQPEPAGRRLDFLLQEFNRESNTLGSKSVDARTTGIAVELKVLIDQVREQAQNIE